MKGPKIEDFLKISKNLRIDSELCLTSFRMVLDGICSKNILEWFLRAGLCAYGLDCAYSTSLSGGNQVDGLPRAPHTAAVAFDSES